MNWESLMVDLSVTLMPVLGSLAAYVLVVIGRFILNYIGISTANSAYFDLEKIVLATVNALSQTVVDDLKQSKANGKLSDEEAGLVKNKAVNSINKQLGSKQLEVLKRKFGCVEELIDNLVEQKVMETKLRKGDF
ncbi:MAG: hypothetical protein ACOWWO_19170 [Peptococcaceae bacterium]